MTSTWTRRTWIVAVSSGIAGGSIGGIVGYVIVRALGW